MLETFDNGVFNLMVSLGYTAHVYDDNDKVVRVDARDARYRNFLFLSKERESHYRFGN